MTNQSHLMLALINTGIAIANNSALKKYQRSCVFVLCCDGSHMGSTIFAGDKKHVEKHFYHAFCEAPAVAVCIKKALDRAMAEPEIAAKINELLNIDNVDDLLSGVLNPEVDE